MRYLPLALGLALLAPACRRDATGPEPPDVTVSAFTGNAQYALPGTELREPLSVRVVDAGTGRPVDDVLVRWRVVQGSATLTEASVRTDGLGLASTRLRLGSATGRYRVEASAERQVGGSASFEAFAITQPILEAVSPAAAVAGDVVVLTGQHFLPAPELNAVLFDGIRGTVLSASTTRLEVRVPHCVPSRTVAVQLWIGAVSSGARPLAATGGAGDVLSLARGEARTFTDPAEFSCLRLAGGVIGARYLVIAQNTATAFGPPLPFTLGAWPANQPLTAAFAPATAEHAALRAPAELPAALRFEHSLRSRERAWLKDVASLRQSRPDAIPALLADPRPGDRRSFKVLNQDDQAETITAEVKAVSDRAIIYQDLDAPAGGFTEADFERFGRLFDDPIYQTIVDVFGAPSDIDGNGRIIILFTPRVNALTTRGEGSLIAGYFYGCDLVAKSRCSNSNSGEIFYSFVPDPLGRYGDARTTNIVLRSVLPVIAHEFEHMISFSSRDQTLDELWLSEGLAHTAEDIVGEVFQQLGDVATARDFTRGNYLRAARFLNNLSSVSLVADDDPGTLELRGAAWLLLRHLRAHHGGSELLRKLTHTRLAGAGNITAQTGMPWDQLLADFAIALHAADAPELAGIPLLPRHTFGNLPVRQHMVADGIGYPLAVNSLTLDTPAADVVPAAGTSMFILAAPGNSAYAPINLVFAGAQGGTFPSSAAPQLVLLRTR